MAISDFMLKTRVNFALVRDPRVGALDIGVTADDGVVTLTGDVDEAEEKRAAEEIARGVEGVEAVRNELTYGVGRDEETAELVVSRFLAKLDEAWAELPDRHAVTEASYLRWALWLIYKFRLPENLECSDRERLESEASEQGLTKVAGHVGAPKALVAAHMLLLVDVVAESPTREAPEQESAPLVTTAPVKQEAA